MAIGQISATGNIPIQTSSTSSVPPMFGGGATGGTGDIGVLTSSQPVTQTSQPTSAPAETSASNAQALKQSVDTINAYLSSVGNNNIEFSINQSTGQLVVQIVDTQTQTVLMQTPSKQALAIAQALDKTQGLLIKTQA